MAGNNLKFNNMYTIFITNKKHSFAGKINLYIKHMEE